MKILTGVYAPDAGQILMDGAPIEIGNAEVAFMRGITATHQETVLFDELTITENIFLGHPLTGRFGLLDWKAMNARTKAILDELEVDLDPATRLRDLAIARKHLVAIARALSVDAKIVIMDEPTASLSHKEVQELYGIVGKLKAAGKAILFISHKFEEIFRIADRYTVFRDGRLVGEGMVAEATPGGLISLMVGRTIDHIFPKVDVPLGDVVFSCRASATQPNSPTSRSISARARSSASTASSAPAAARSCRRSSASRTPPAGRSRSAASRSSSAARPTPSLPASSTCRRSASGRASCWPCRCSRTCRCPRSAAWTAPASSISPASSRWRGATPPGSISAPPALSQEVGTLSGGNQQKVVIGKWLATEPRVIILDEPTKGIDVGSKAAVHAFMGELTAQGLAVVMVSSELPEILGMSDRVIVMREGRVAGRFDRANFSAEALVAAATGNLAAEAA